MHLNGVRIGEIGITTLMASYFNIPTILVAGDTAACLEAKKFIGEDNLITVETKKSISRYSVVNLNPVKIREELTINTQKAMKHASKMKPKKIDSPYEYKIQLMCPNAADYYEKLGAERINHQTIILRSNDFLDLCAQRLGWGTGVHNKKFGIKQF